MARTFIDQPTQVFNSDTYNDSFASGVQLVSSSTSLEDDLNALRTQVRQVLWAGQTGNWYDDIQGVANIAPARGLNTINSALSTVEQQRFIYDVQSLALVQIPTGSNWVGLSVSGSTAPAGQAAVGLGATTGSFTGSLVATLPGAAWTAHSLNLVSGTSAISPRNLVAIRDAYTHEAILDQVNGNHEIYGLLQIDSTATDGTAFSDTSPGRTQISFVVEYPSGTFIAADATQIGGRSINYVYRKRTTLLGLPDDAYANTVFVDVTPLVSGGFAHLSDITLQEAILNQGGSTVQQSGNFTNIDLAAGGNGSWAFLSGSQTLWRLLASTNTAVVGADNFLVNSANPASFLKGVSVATGSTQIDIGVALGTIGTKGVQDLILSGGGLLKLNDQYGASSNYGGPIALAASQAEWNTFYADFGSKSILGAFNFLSSSLSGSTHRDRASAGVTANLTANTNVSYPTNLDAQLLSLVGRDFVKDVNVYLNGILCMPALTGINDVYPGTNLANGDLKFTMKLRSGSIISVERF